MRTMQQNHKPWKIGEERQVYLVAIDIIGFSQRREDPFSMLEARTDLTSAIRRTSLSDGLSEEWLRAQFLGDEVRIALPRTYVPAVSLLKFLDEALDSLEKSNTRVRAVVLSGAITPTSWQGCQYLKGELAFKAQRWLGVSESLKDGCFAADGEIKNLMLSSTGGRNWTEKRFDNESGWLLE